MSSSKKPISSKSIATTDSEIKKNNSDKKHPKEHSFVLSKREAKAASPADMAVCGEEDPGEALEFLVTEAIPAKDNN